MHFVTFPFIALFLASIVGCTSADNVTSPVRSITAMTQEDSTRIFWLDERLGHPEKLTELFLKGSETQFNTEYRWLDGVVREIQGEGDVWIEGKLKNQSFIIRYDSKGLGVYQNNRVDGDLLPIKNVELNRYYQQSKNAFKTAKGLEKGKQFFFQGHLRNRTFENCTSNVRKTLRFDKTFPSNWNEKINSDEFFIAAVGRIGGKTDVVEEIVYLGELNKPCFEPFAFEKSKN